MVGAFNQTRGLSAERLDQNDPATSIKTSFGSRQEGLLKFKFSDDNRTVTGAFH